MHVPPPSFLHRQTAANLFYVTLYLSSPEQVQIFYGQTLRGATDGTATWQAISSLLTLFADLLTLRYPMKPAMRFSEASRDESTIALARGIFIGYAAIETSKLSVPELPERL
ncbi:hypothetical protein VTN77DRAFT_1105 [Rasamsonia byssochlamydoides]|uniref:uncharacterized protein n=1 Tax=Rasamsonia byssochlamydoides TaxID=89139 RepID=UPI0037423C75